MFDVLNSVLGLRAVKPFSTTDPVVLCLCQRANIVAAMRAHGEIDGVTCVEPNAQVGDGSDIKVAKVVGTWRLVMRRARGDCPSGCIIEELSFIAVAYGEATEIGPARARRMETFAPRTAKGGWRLSGIQQQCTGLHGDIWPARQQRRADCDRGDTCGPALPSRDKCESLF